MPPTQARSERSPAETVSYLNSELSVSDCKGSIRVMLGCEDVRRKLQTGEEVEEELAALCVRLKEKEFYDLVKSWLPALRGNDTDSDIPNSNFGIMRMREAAKEHLGSKVSWPEGEGVCGFRYREGRLEIDVRDGNGVVRTVRQLEESRQRESTEGKEDSK